MKKYSYLVGIILFVLILTRVDFNNLWQNIKDVKLIYLIIAFLLTFPMLFIKSLCWNYIKKQQKIKYNLKNSFLMYCSGLYIGSFTPGKIGEISKALYLKKDGHSMGKSLVSVVLDRLSDFVFLLFFIFFGSLFFVTIIQKQILIFIIGITIAIVLFLLFLKIGIIKWFASKLFNKLIPKRYQKSWKLNFQDFINDLKIYKLKNYLIIFFITTFSWLFYYIQMYTLGHGANIIGVPFLYFAVIVTIAGFITLIPISISGIGTRDIALIFLLAPFMITKEQVITFSALIFLMYLSASLVGLICWLIKPIKL